MPVTRAEATASAPHKFWTVVLTASAIFAALLVLYPAIDLAFARQFYLGSGRFAGGEIGTSLWLRNAFIALYAAGCLAAVAGLVITRAQQRTFLNVAFPKWLFVIVCLVVGPGIVANLVLKDHMGRARPRDVVEFGGTHHFSGAAVPASECVRNCSFVCGESSSIFALFFAAACLTRRRFAQMVAAGLSAGMVAGLIRMSQGAHFFSDVLFSAVFMAATVFALHRCFAMMQSARILPAPDSTAA